MKAVDIERDHMKASYIEQLNKLGFYGTSDMSYDELKQRLAIERFKRIDHDSAKNAWFE